MPWCAWRTLQWLFEVHIILLALLGILLVFGPQFWAQYVLRRHSKHQDHFPGTGGELARHLLDRQGLLNVRVEQTDSGDHYDPLEKCVRLTPSNLNGKSLTAVAVAAHEVGHAIQDHTDYGPLKIRTNLVQIAQRTEKIASGAMLILPVVVALARSPTAGFALFLAGFAGFALSTLVHLVTLPVEWDASFGRALPLLRNHISQQEERAARRILRACAFTYVAGSLASLFNLWRWMTVLWRK